MNNKFPVNISKHVEKSMKNSEWWMDRWMKNIAVPVENFENHTRDVVLYARCHDMDPLPTLLVLYVVKPPVHDDVIKWKHFPCYWPFVRGIHRSPVNSLHKGQWRGALMFSLICVWINGSVNNGEVGDLRGYCTHYDVTVMHCRFPALRASNIELVQPFIVSFWCLLVKLLNTQLSYPWNEMP